MQLFCFLLSIPVIFGADFLGPAMIKLVRLEKCGEDGPDAYVNFTVSRVNRTHQGVNIFLNSPIVFGEGTEINGSISKWGDGGWKPHFYDVYDSNACEFFMKYAKDKFIELLKERNLPEQCPVEKGIYEVKNYVFDGLIDVPLFFGEFKIDMILKHDGVTMTCAIIYANSEPRYSILG